MLRNRCHKNKPIDFLCVSFGFIQSFAARFAICVVIRLLHSFVRDEMFSRLELYVNNIISTVLCESNEFSMHTVKRQFQIFYMDNTTTIVDGWTFRNFFF